MSKIDHISSILETQFEMQTDLFRQENSSKADGKPFVGQSVVFLGRNAQYPSKTLKSLFEELGAEIKNDISKNVTLVFKLSDLDEKQRAKLDEMIYNGYSLIIYGTEDIDSIVNGVYEPYKYSREPKKVLSITAKHIECSLLNMDYKANQNGVPMTNPIYGKEIFCSSDVPGKRIVLSSMFGLLGAYCNTHSLNYETDTVLITNKTLDLIRKNEKSQSLLNLEEYYNTSDKIYFNYRFLTVEAFLSYVKDRIELLHDSVLESAYNEYIKSI